MKIKIVTDSSSDCDEEFLKKYDVEILPIEVIFGNEIFLDGVNLTKSEFYERLQKSKDIPKTSLINQSRFEDLFIKWKEQGYHVLLAPISKQLSGTYQSACLAKDKVKADNVYIVDTNLVTFCLGLFVRIVAEKLSEGVSFDDLCEFADKTAKKIKLFAVVDTLKYLKAGGRISGTTAIIGSLFDIHPIVSNDDGKIISVHKCKGYKNGLKFVLSKLDLADDNFPIIIGHSTARDMAINLQTEVSKGQLLRCNIAEIGCTVGAHAGPNCLGVAYVEK